MRYFRLLVGAHQETLADGKVKDYQAIEERDKKGNIVRSEQPIVVSERDLVKLFGTGKFVEVPENQVHPSLRSAGNTESEPVGQSVKPSDSADLENKDEIQQAAERGAEDISGDLGKDVTSKFITAINANLKVFLKPPGRYTIFDPDDNKIVTAGGPISKDRVEQCIEDYLET